MASGAGGHAAEPDLVEWLNGCALNPARVESSRRDDPAVQQAMARAAGARERGLDRLAGLAMAPG